MREFSLIGFAAFLGGLQFEVEHMNRVALERAARIVEAESKRVLGTYDYGWPPLAPSTIAGKENGDTPLLETGEMRDSIEHRSDHKEAHIGSDNDKAVWHELGTRSIPPRSFLAGAAMHKTEEILDVVGRTIVAGLSGEAIAGPNTLLPLP